MIALLALAAALLEFRGPVTGLPLSLLLIVAIQLGGLLIAREGELWNWFRVWFMLLAITLTLLPTLAIQSASSRVPYVALTNGSAGLLIVATLVSIAAIVGTTVLAAALAADAPESASILLTPALLLVPSVLGVPGDLGERSALLALAVACGGGAVATAVGWILPRSSRPLVGPVALGGQFVALWMLGFGQVVAPGRGFIVPTLGAVLLITTALAAVTVPILALVANRFVQTVRNQPTDQGTTRSDPDSQSQERQTRRSRLSAPCRHR